MKEEKLLLEGGNDYIQGLSALDAIKKKSYNSGFAAGVIFSSLCVGAYYIHKRQKQQNLNLAEQDKESKRYCTL